MPLDATNVKSHEGAHVVSKAIVIATGVSATGEREVLGLEVGDSEDGAFWTAFLRSLRSRGLGGVKLVISDAHEGLTQAIGAVMLGAAWQRCRVHFARNSMMIFQGASWGTPCKRLRSSVAHRQPPTVVRLKASLDQTRSGPPGTLGWHDNQRGVDGGSN